MSTFSHVTLGTTNLDRALSFYDSVFVPLGLKRLMHIESKVAAWGKDAPEFIILYPRDGEEATCANGLTVGLRAPDKSAVDEFHRIALAAGATDEGAPGPRPIAADAYAAYIRDLDGHKICVGCRTGE